MHSLLTLRIFTDDQRANIGIIVVVDGGSEQLDDYELAIRTVRCYSTYHKYPFYLIDVGTNSTISFFCPQEDVG
uniref:Uncharacterized protein n=1 Tax=Ditylenchus dipsaci TaxID=166011 RepID=A0A915EBL6_9BILA